MYFSFSRGISPVRYDSGSFPDNTYNSIRDARRDFYARRIVSRPSCVCIDARARTAGHTGVCGGAAVNDGYATVDGSVATAAGFRR